jgi:hypothetical protein
MRSGAFVLPVLSLLAGAACLQKPAEVAFPRLAEIVLQATTFAECPPDTSCDASQTATVRRGPLVFVDADSVVMVDVNAGEQVAVRPGPTVILEIYRGQKTSVNAIAKNAGKGALIGGVVAAAATAAFGGIMKAFHGGDGDLGKAIVEAGAHGAVTGAFTGGFKGAANGEAAWQRITILQLRQDLCRCARPDSVSAVPAPAPLIP